MTNDNEASPLSPPCAVSEMRRIADEGGSLMADEMAGVMAGVLAYIAASGTRDHQSIDEIVREWNLRDEWPRCPACRGPAIDLERPDESFTRTCYEGCGHEEVI